MRPPTADNKPRFYGEAETDEGEEEETLDEESQEEISDEFEDVVQGQVQAYSGTKKECKSETKLGEQASAKVGKNHLRLYHAAFA